MSGVVPQLRRQATERARPTTERIHRYDIDGLRALAIALVVAYHVWFGRVSGGVDVFLMISAYFMTGSLARRFAAGAPAAVPRYWVDRFRRLLPAAAVTLVGVLAAAWVAYPPSTWTDIWRQTWASLFYVQNWELAAASVDYYAREETIPSPLQHFWSLSIQGQVFLAWPVLILLVAMIARRWGASVRAALTVVFSTVFAASFAYSVYFTAVNQQAAYFDTFARLWEFALGSLLALAASHLRLGPVAAAIVGWLGIVGLVSCGLVLDVQGGFPGYLALWPTLSAAAVIVAGQTATSLGPTRLLSSPPLAWIGKIAYALYLVHWPVLITWLVVTESTSLGLLPGTAVILVSLALAVVLTYAVEKPIRESAWLSRSAGRGLVAIVASIALVAVPLATWTAVEDARSSAIAASHENPGARVLLPGGGADSMADYPVIVPLATELDSEWVGLDGECTGARRPADTAIAASCLELRAPAPAAGTVVVVGDSHAQQWAAAVVPIAQERGLNVVALLKAGCSFAADEPAVPGVEGCDEWREGALTHIAALRPDMVVGMATKSAPGSRHERLLGGIEQTVDRLTELGAEVVLIRDNPRFDEDMFDCVAESAGAAEECVHAVEDVLARRNPAARLERADVRVVDLTDYLCPDGLCLPVIGGVVVYLDDNHLTGTYAGTLAEALALQL